MSGAPLGARGGGRQVGNNRRNQPKHRPKVAWGNNQIHAGTSAQQENVAAAERRRAERLALINAVKEDGRGTPQSAEERKLENDLFGLVEDYRVCTLGQDDLDLLWSTCEKVEKRLQHLHYKRLEEREEFDDRPLIRKNLKKDNFIKRRLRSMVGRLDEKLEGVEHGFRDKSANAQRSAGEDELCAICCYCQ